MATFAFFYLGKGFQKKSELTTTNYGLKNVFRKSLLNKPSLIKQGYEGITSEKQRN